MTIRSCTNLTYLITTDILFTTDLHRLRRLKEDYRMCAPLSSSNRINATVPKIWTIKIPVIHGSSVTTHITNWFSIVITFKLKYNCNNVWTSFRINERICINLANVKSKDCKQIRMSRRYSSCNCYFLVQIISLYKKRSKLMYSSPNIQSAFLHIDVT